MPTIDTYGQRGSRLQVGAGTPLVARTPIAPGSRSGTLSPNMAKRRRKRDHFPKSNRLRARPLVGTLESVEFSRGHDGFLRGRPEPVLLFGVYLVDAEATIPLARAIQRLSVAEPYPSLAPLAATVLFRTRVSRDATRVIVLALAVEDDGGEDVRSLYAALVRDDAFSAWVVDDEMPQPAPLVEMHRQKPLRPPRAARVNILCDGVDLRDGCTRDEFVGACTIALDADRPLDDEWHLHFLADDGRNDWTAHLRMRT